VKQNKKKAKKKRLKRLHKNRMHVWEANTKKVRWREVLAGT
jgi:hypothetical protein